MALGTGHALNVLFALKRRSLPLTTVRNLFNPLPREQVEKKTKCLLFLDDDYGMSNSGVGDFSETDRTVVILKMHDRSFDFSNCADLGQFAYVLWANLNSVGSARLRQLRAAQTRDAAERALAARN